MDNDRNMELLACFDETGNCIEPHSRKDVHEQPLKYWHAVVNIWVINSKGKILCTKRSNKNEGNPNKWQSYVGGHVEHKDSFKKAAVRELNEELGLTEKEGKIIFFKKEIKESWKHIEAMFVFFWNGNAEDIKTKDEEIDEVNWMNFYEYEYEKDEHPERWCNSLDSKRYKEILQLRV